MLRDGRSSLDLTHRAEPADLPELMDEPCSYGDFRACLRDLAEVNRFTLAHRATMGFLNRILTAERVGRALVRAERRPMHILDVGSGGGDMLRHIARWASRRGLPVLLTGVDLNPYAARAAREFTSADARIRWVTGDAFTFVSGEPVDVVISSLFTHHLPSPEIVRFLRWMDATAVRGWFINDLYRSRTAIRLFGAGAKLMRWHRFVQHDGPVSLRRSFRVADWQALYAAAQLPAGVLINRRFPSRLCVEFRK